MQPREIERIPVLHADHTGVHISTGNPLSGSSLEREGKEEQGNPYVAQ
jgi:hypothetical protein